MDWDEIIVSPESTIELNTVPFELMENQKAYSGLTHIENIDAINYKFQLTLFLYYKTQLNYVQAIAKMHFNVITMPVDFQFNVKNADAVECVARMMQITVLQVKQAIETNHPVLKGLVKPLPDNQAHSQAMALLGAVVN